MSLCIFGKGGDLLIGEVIGDDGAFDAAFRCSINWFDSQIMSIMHYIPRSKGGLGIEQNGALGCQYHHTMLDNGYQGRRAEMLEMFKGYLQNHYDNWNEEELYYRKWR